MTISALSMLGWAAEQAGEVDRGLHLRERAVALARGQNDRLNLATALSNLGLSLLTTDEHACARAPLEESLALCRALGDLKGIASAIDAANLGYTSITPSFALRPLEDRFLPSVRDTLGENEFRAQWVKGQAMRREDSIAYALEHH